jgi:hypothetical protein
MPKQKKPAMTPQAAKILEQYRNAGKSQTNAAAPGNGDEAEGSAPRPSSPPPPSSIRPRSGTRGK